MCVCVCVKVNEREALLTILHPLLALAYLGALKVEEAAYTPPPVDDAPVAVLKVM